ncbi:radical SAM/SPASM domain-containing protein [Adlercreutzia sp. ZJ242]|uniref:radical SAM/SPASM domain-containing protein n=1 Tax=Adlercreutzia sp. ZJ242 TaxID=2709409 RepID=UPI0013EC8C67|nr:radical SAM protein [Adlercreutzia sp. ZJ242]
MDTFWITLNRGCSLRCSYCYAKDAPLSVISPGVLRGLVDLACEMDVGSIVYTGGEPSLYDGLNDAIVLAKSKGISCGFPSNGLLYGDIAEAVSLAETNVDSVSLSLKGWDEDSYLRKTGVDGYAVALRAALNLVKAGIPVVASMVVESGEIMEWMSAIAMLKDRAGVDAFSFVPAFDSARMKTGVSLAAEFASEFRGVYCTLDELTEGNFVVEQNMPMCLWDMDLINEMAKKNQLRSVCQLFRGNGAVFDCDGKLIPCNSLFKYPIGSYGADFITADQFMAHLNSAKVREAVNSIISPPSRECLDCELYPVCAGGCATRWIHYSFEECKAI